MAALSGSRMDQHERKRVWTAASVIALQLLAAIYFLVDAASEDGGAPGLVELVVGLALLAGIGWGALTLRRLHLEAARREQTLSVARGALGEILAGRFRDWGLSRAEAEVALFALKGCSIADIAAMRGSAEGTVRSQLSQIYTKAGVGGQPGLMALFLDDLLDDSGLTPKA
jgi:DNA-binding CsgD family transcriptional regulator